MLHAVIHPVPPHHAAHAGTAVTVALSCVRRAWLSERFAAAGGGPGAAATRGTLLHELLQRLMVEVVGMEAGAELPGVEQLEQMVSRVVRQSAFFALQNISFCWSWDILHVLTNQQRLCQLGRSKHAYVAAHELGWSHASACTW